MANGQVVLEQHTENCKQSCSSFRDIESILKYVKIVQVVAALSHLKSGLPYVFFPPSIVQFIHDLMLTLKNMVEVLNKEANFATYPIFQ